MAFEVLSKATIVQTFAARSADEPLDWEALGLPVLEGEFEGRQSTWRSQLEGGRFLVPAFKPRRNRRKNRPELKLDHAPESSGFWCGAITAPRVAGDRMAWVEGQWVAPLVSLPPDAVGGQNYVLSSWIGMDGDYDSDDVLQAGIDAWIGLINGTIQYKYQPWWQWYPGKSWTIDAVGIAPGDVVSCKIVAAAGAPAASASIVLSNLTKGEHTTFSVSAPSVEAALAGRCAEWIVEAFGTLGPMAGFPFVEFDNCYSGTASGQTLASGQGAPIQMVGPGGIALASATLSGPTTVRIT